MKNKLNLNRQKITTYLLILGVIGCENIDYDLTPLNYEKLETFDSGYDILTEGVNPNDNLIFSKCNTFTFNYSIEKNGKKLLGKSIESNEFNPRTNWNFIDYEDRDTQVYIDKFIFFTPVETNQTVSPNQSLIKVKWLNSDNSLLIDSNEGIIENHKNIWMHPLRGYHMWPTFTAPWPYVEYPVLVGKKYKWWKKLDGGWGSDKYIQWDKIIHFDYEYEVIGTQVVIIKGKNIDTYKIKAIGKSELGETTVDFYFNPTLGFVKSDYKLMDDSRIIMNMIDFELDCNYQPEIPSFEKKSIN